MGRCSTPSYRPWLHQQVHVLTVLATPLWSNTHLPSCCSGVVLDVVQPRASNVGPTVHIHHRMCHRRVGSHPPCHVLLQLDVCPSQHVGSGGHPLDTPAPRAPPPTTIQCPPHRWPWRGSSPRCSRQRWHAAQHGLPSRGWQRFPARHERARFRRHVLRHARCSGGYVGAG